MSLSGKVALVTIGPTSLGTMDVPALAREGAELALHYDALRHKNQTIQFRDELQAQYTGRRVSVHSGELATAAAVEQLFSDILSEHGRIDMVVNTVGMILKKPIPHMSEPEYDKMFAYAVFVDQQRMRWVQRYREALERRTQAK